MDGTDHIVTFEETANRSASLLPSEVESLDAPGDIELHEYNVYGQTAECSCGEYFDSHAEGVDHLRQVRSAATDAE